MHYKINKCTFPLKARDIYRKIAWKQQTKNTTLSKLKITHSFTMWRIITLTLYQSGKLSGLIWSWWGSEKDKASNYSRQQTSDCAHRRQRGYRSRPACLISTGTNQRRRGPAGTRFSRANYEPFCFCEPIQTLKRTAWPDLCLLIHSKNKNSKYSKVMNTFQF